jgi:hypothetical protein
MNYLQRFTGLLAAVLLLVPIASANWSDNFDAYVAGTGLIGQGGWEGWDNAAGADALVSALYSLSAPNSAQILPTSDLIHQWSGYTSGQWVIKAWQYVPTSFVGQGYFLLLNTYNHGGPYNWSCQVMMDGGTNLVQSDPEAATLPLIRGQWVEIRVEIDLDLDLQTFYYGGQMLYQKSWINGVSGAGVANIACMDLYGNNADFIYYDDMSLAPPQPTPTETATWGQIKAIYR